MYHWAVSSNKTWRPKLLFMPPQNLFKRVKEKKYFQFTLSLVPERNQPSAFLIDPPCSGSEEMNLNMNSAESLVMQIQGLSGTAEDLAQLYNLLKQSEDLLLSDSARSATFLNELDPSKHSLGYLYIL